MSVNTPCPACQDATETGRVYDLDVDEAVVRIYGCELHGGEFTQVLDAQPVPAGVAAYRNPCPDCEDAARAGRTTTITVQDADVELAACGRHTALARETLDANTLSYKL